MASTSHTTPSADTPANGASKPLTGPILPLTSFANTPQNVACISFLLGTLFSAGCLCFIFGPREDVWWSVITSKKLGAYLACWSFFHLTEFVVTATWNPTRVSVSSFLLNNGSAYHIAHTAAVLEFVLEESLLPAHLKAYKHLLIPTCIGALMIIAGQYIRTIAMITASQSFTHIISFKKSDDHTLVTHGVYGWLRHPSYAAFLWWSIGTQVWLGNPVGIIAFTLVVWNFFSSRIREEERLLVHFFGKEYEDYRKRVGTAIPFIP